MSLGPDVTVASVLRERIAEATGFASNLYRVHLAGSETLPESVIVKLRSDAEAYRNLGESTGMYSREVDYYAIAAEAAPLSAPPTDDSMMTSVPSVSPNRRASSGCRSASPCPRKPCGKW